MKILLADDHDLVRDTLAAFLEMADDIEVATVADLDTACAAIAKQGDFDLVLLDYEMPGMNGLEGLRRAIELSEGKPVAVMSGTAPKSVAQDALGYGAIGFIPKTMGAKSLINVVNFMAAGEVFVPIKFMTESPVSGLRSLNKSLSARELDVLGGLCRGLANKEIARELEL